MKGFSPDMDDLFEVLDGNSGVDQCIKNKNYNFNAILKRDVITEVANGNHKLIVEKSFSD